VLYTIFEAVFATLFLLSYLTFGLSLKLALFLAVIVVLGFIVLYDLRHTIVPFGSMLLLALLSLAFAALTTPTTTGFLLVLGVACIIGFAFFLLHILSRGRAMGLGDAPVAFALSLLVGSQAVAGLVFSFWIGAVIGIFILVLRRGGPKMGIEVPFVPFLAIGYLLAFFTQWNPFIF
jgi:prepilin signal peptidase PulO-like enzyme (type II secretory pathway)